jgi:hypothetical protein
LIDYKFDWGSTDVHEETVITVDTVVRVHLCPECSDAARKKINPGRAKYSKAARASRKLIFPLLIIWFFVPFLILQLRNLLIEGPIGPLPFPWDIIIFLPMATIPHAIMGMSTVVIILTLLRGIHGELEANPYYVFLHIMQWAVSLHITVKNEVYYDEFVSLNPNLEVEYDPEYEWSTVAKFLVNRFAWVAMLLPFFGGFIILIVFLPSFTIPLLIPLGFLASFILLTLLSFKAPKWIATPDVESEFRRPKRLAEIDDMEKEFVPPGGPIHAACPTCKTESVFHPAEFLPSGKVKCKSCLGLFKPDALAR